MANTINLKRRHQITLTLLLVHETNFTISKAHLRCICELGYHEVTGKSKCYHPLTFVFQVQLLSFIKILIIEMALSVSNRLEPSPSTGLPPHCMLGRHALRNPLMIGLRELPRCTQTCTVFCLPLVSCVPFSFF